MNHVELLNWPYFSCTTISSTKHFLGCTLKKSRCVAKLNLSKKTLIRLKAHYSRNIAMKTAISANRLFGEAK